jgi:hypothetical protein
MDELGELPSDVAMKKKETVLRDSMVTVRLSEPEPALGGSAVSGTASGTAAVSPEIGGKLEVDNDESGDKDEDKDSEGEDEEEEGEDEKEKAKTTPSEQIAGGVIPEEEEDSDDTEDGSPWRQGGQEGE